MTPSAGAHTLSPGIVADTAGPRSGLDAFHLFRSGTMKPCLGNRCAEIVPAGVAWRTVTGRNKGFVYCAECVGFFVARDYSIKIDGPLDLIT